MGELLLLLLLLVQLQLLLSFRTLDFQRERKQDEETT